jgi:MinD superfamily P-loop ATPase
MQISIVSGKGGTGKTTLAARLFMSREGSTLLDCDVEEPNAGLFLNVSWDSVETVNSPYPIIDENLCTHCGSCASFCSFKAILSTGKVTIPLAERCHACGGCALVCPENAVTYGSRAVGKIGRGRANGGVFAYGCLSVGEYSGVGIIRRLRESAEGDLVLIDGPPGTACSAVAAVNGSDYAVLVGEPTPFGVSDMSMAVEMLRKLGVPFGVVVNKAGIGDREIYDFCGKENLQIVGEIPFDRSMAEDYAAGRKGFESDDRTNSFRQLGDAILRAAGYAGVRA